MPILIMVAKSTLQFCIANLFFSWAWLCVCVGLDRPCRGMVSNPPLIHVGAALQAASLLWLHLGEKFSLMMAGMSVFSFLASTISTTHLVAVRMLAGSWARQVFCRSALVMLGLSCRLAIIFMDRRISSICTVFSLKSNTTPNLCKVLLPMMRSYLGASTPELYSPMSSLVGSFYWLSIPQKIIQCHPPYQF